MNHFKARERRNAAGGHSGLWHYTNCNDDYVYPVGYCAQDCPGHATEGEACEHYKQYLIDEMTRISPKTGVWPKHKCKVEGCENEGTHAISVGGYSYYEVCEEHADKGTLGKLLTVGESWES